MEGGVKMIEKQKPKEELTLKYTKDELVLEATDLEQDKDIELFKKVENESFFILKKDMYIIFFPEDIHRPGLSSTEMRGVRKVIFKILI